MNKYKAERNQLLFHWIKTDPLIKKHLRDIQIKMLIERILQEKSFDEMGKIYKVTSEKIKTLFAVVLWKIQKYIQPNIGHLIVKRNTLLEQEQQNQEQAYPFYFNRIYLN